MSETFPTDLRIAAVNFENAAQFAGDFAKVHPKLADGANKARRTVATLRRVRATVNKALAAFAAAGIPDDESPLVSPVASALSAGVAETTLGVTGGGAGSPEDDARTDARPLVSLEQGSYAVDVYA